MVTKVGADEFGGELEGDGKDPAAKALGKKGGKARASKLTLA